jgi:hypothetical protein
MNKTIRIPLYKAVIVLIGALLTFSPLCAQDKPLLSAEIQKVIDAEGAAAAKARFAEIYPEQAGDYNVDVEGMTALGMTYMQKGDMERGGAVLEMMSTVMQTMSAGAMYGQGGQNSEMFQEMARQEEAEKARLKAEREQERQYQQQREDQARGKSRDDLDRFTGLWAQPENRDERRSLWVMPTCDGYLATGATWGDASPIMMRSASDTVFSYSDSFQSFSYEFKADKLVHDWNSLPGPLVRIGPVPDEYGECLNIEVRR